MKKQIRSILIGGLGLILLTNGFVNLGFNSPYIVERSNLNQEISTIRNKKNSSIFFDNLFGVKNQKDYLDSLNVWNRKEDSLEAKIYELNAKSEKYLGRIFVFGYFTE